MQQWGSVAVDRLLARSLPVPIFVENDAAAAAMGEMQFGLGIAIRASSICSSLRRSAAGSSWTGSTSGARTAAAASSAGYRPATSSGAHRQLQKIVSLSALYSRLAAQGYHAASPPELLNLDERAQVIVDAWIAMSAETLVDPLLAVNCLINPEAVLIGGRLPAPLVDRLADALNRRLQAHADTMPAIAPVARAAMSDDAPAVGAAILPFSHRAAAHAFRLDEDRSELHNDNDD